MRLRLQLSPWSFRNAVTGVVWVGADEVFSVSDDHNLCRWTVSKTEGTFLPNPLKETIFPTSLHSSLFAGGLSSLSADKHNLSVRSGKKQQRSAIHTSQTGNNLILMTASDGKVHLITSAGKIERSIDAHQGAAILARWNTSDPGGTGGFVSCGEDGSVKMWSRNGMLRSVLAQLGKPVYAVDWNGNSNKLVYCAGEECFIKQMKAQNAPTKWRAHTGLVLCLSWSAVTDLIVSGGEDCRYRLWDGQGRPLWSSTSHGHPLCSVSWSPNGEIFAIGSYNLIRLCDKSGWTHSVERPSSGSIYSLSWSNDGVQLVGGCANGQLLHAHVVERRLMWEQLEAVQTRKKVINIRDLSSEVARERLETRDRVVRFELGFNYLVVATTKQCYIFSAKNWNAPIIADLKEGAGPVSLIRLCEKCFLLVENSSVQLFNFEGRILSTIRIPSSPSGEPFTEQTAAIANDLIVLRDQAQHSLVHLFDPQNGRTAGDGPITHNLDVTELCVNMCGSFAERRVAFVDLNGDCFLSLVNCYGSAQRTAKIGSLISCLSSNNSTNMLAALQDNQRLIVWTLPTVAFMDRDLLPSTQIELGNSAELGKSSTIVGYIKEEIRCVQHGQWDQAVRICRTMKEEFLWATLAGLAGIERNYKIAEICYGQLEEVEKVLFLSELRSQNVPQLRDAMVAQFSGQRREADTTLVNAGKAFEALMLNLGTFRFDRAMELATKMGRHLDTVLGYRQRYLGLLGRKETDQRYLKHHSEVRGVGKCVLPTVKPAKVEVDWPHIYEKIQEDEAKTEDTNEDILQLAKKLGYPSIEAMLDSVDLSDLVEPCFTDLAKGAGNENPKKVFSYRVKGSPMIAHILSTIEESAHYKDMKAEKHRQLEVLIGDPKYNPNILKGKEHLLALIYNLGGQERFVDLTELRKVYEQVHGAELNRAALKKFFPTGQLKNIMDKYLYQDIELATDQNKNGSLLFRMKRPYKEICEEIVRITEEREKHKEEQRKFRQDRRNSKKPKGPAQQPKKLKVINPPPPPKPSMVNRANDLYTDDPMLFRKIATVSVHGHAGGGEEQCPTNGTTEDEGSENEIAKRYTTRVEGATYTDDEEECMNDGDGEGKDADQENGLEMLDEDNSSSRGSIVMANTRAETPAEEQNGDDEAEAVEDRAAKRMVMVRKMLEERKAFEEQVKMRNEVSGEVKGVFTETKRSGRRAREEEARRERVAKLLKRVESKMAEMEPMVVNDRLNEKSKRRIAVLVVELIWANRELGLSEVKNMLALLLGRIVEIDVAQFITTYCKCLKLVRAPVEPHIVIVDECRKQIGKEIIDRGRKMNKKLLKNL
uniref:WD_REPEATS_REGION domain-containing protein n=1 Tax=Globodera pallida TaxID=36090 RepID=A0A183BU10_GLOPA